MDKDEIRDHITLAEECLEEAKNLLSNGFYRGAVEGLLFDVSRIQSAFTHEKCYSKEAYWCAENAWLRIR